MSGKGAHFHALATVDDGHLKIHKTTFKKKA
jgi:hypothetical protein